MTPGLPKRNAREDEQERNGGDTTSLMAPTALLRSEAVVHVREALPHERASWEQFVAANGSFLQSWRWGDLRSSQGWQAVRLVALNGTTLVGVVQALVRRFAPGVAMLYVPRGPVVTANAALRPLLDALQAVGKRRRAMVLRLEPEWLATPDNLMLCHERGWQPAPVSIQLPHTVVVNLDQTPEQLLASFKPTWRRYIRHAPKRGVEVREGTIEDLSIFYALERETAVRQGTLGRSLEYYRSFFAQFAGEGARLFIAELEGEPLGAIITLERGRSATYLYGGSTRRHQEVHPNYLLQWTAMRHAQAAGCVRYDMWGCGPPDDPTSSEAGLTAFKSGFAPVVRWVGAWDAPLSPLYPAWRALEAQRKVALQWRAKRGRGRTEEAKAVDASELAVRDVTNTSGAQWDAWLAASPGGGHWMQTHAWGEFKRQQGRGTVRLVLEEGSNVVGAAEVTLYPLPVLGSLAYCAKGPWLDWSRADHVAAFFQGARRLLRKRRVFAFQIEPEALEADERLKEQLDALGFRRYWTNHQFKTTMIVDLTPDEAGLQSKMSQTARRYIRSAQRNGVQVSEETGLAARDAFHRLFVATSARDGFFMRPRSYLMAGWQALLATGHGRFLFARKDGVLVAAMFLTSFNNKIWYKDGASSEEGQKAYAPYLLQWEAMRWGKAHGATYYDMVAIPDPDQLENREHEMWGLYDFKRKFGGEVGEFVRAYKQPYGRRVAAIWDRVEPLYYRVYMRLKKDVYY